MVVQYEALKIPEGEPPINEKWKVYHAFLVATTTTIVNFRRDLL
jgi:hypothetical protein